MSGRVQLLEAVQRDSFISGIVGYPVYMLKDVGAWLLLQELATKGSLMAYIKAPVNDRKGNARLLEQGWQLVDTNVQLSKISSRLYQSKPAGVTFRLACPEDEEEVARIARESFGCSRWHQDDRISKEIANKIKEEWVRNFWRGKRGDYMVLAEWQGKVIGFNQLLKQSDGTLVIDLIAVDAKSRQRGVGRGMIGFAEEACGPMTKIVVGTQLTNIPSLKMYQSCGFAAVESNHIFHCHLSRG